MRRSINLTGIAFCCALAVAVPLKAETLPIEGVYPAGNDSLSALGSLAIGPFTGQEGQSFAIELEQGLRNVYVRGMPYFDIVSLRNNTSADGTLRGSASERTESRREVSKKQVCTAKNAKGKCVERRWVDEYCTRRIITLSYTLVVEGRRGERLFVTDNAAENSSLICADTQGVPGVDWVIRQLISNVAQELRFQFAPVELRNDVRVKEGVEGLQGNAKSKFKDGIKLTKRNVASACEVWAEVDVLVPNHAPTLFNLGLCAESDRDYDAAESFYRRALNIDRSEDYITEALQRLDLRRHAERQLEVHFRDGTS